MTSTFQLVLDTTAPVVTWGAVDGAAITETMTVQYVLNEPSLISAELELADSRRVAMTVAPDHLSVVVPDDAPEGWGRVLAVVRDSTHNTATRELAVYVSGVLEPPPTPTVQPPTGGLPAAAYHQTKDWGASVAQGSDSFTVTVAVSSTSSTRARSRYSPPPSQRRVFTDRLRVVSSYTTGVRASGPASAAQLSSSSIVIRRGEGPDTMDELMLLDLL